MIGRKDALNRIIEQINESTAIISPLGRISRDLYAITSKLREHCFYNIGAMGSILPFALGLAIAKPLIFFYAIEGDGSLLMNLGSLVTFKRYLVNNLLLIVMDNRLYESTGGQTSQPEDFLIENVCKSVGLSTKVINTKAELDNFLTSSTSHQVLVIKTFTEPPEARIDNTPDFISNRFSNWINK